MKNAEGLDTTFGGFLPRGRLFADLIRPFSFVYIERKSRRKSGRPDLNR